MAQAIEFNRGEMVEWIIDDHQRLVLMHSDEAVKELKINLRNCFDALSEKGRCAFNQVRTWERAKDLAHGILSCMGRSTITGWLVSSGLQFKDWSASYKLFTKSRINNDALFSVS